MALREGYKVKNNKNNVIKKNSFELISTSMNKIEANKKSKERKMHANISHVYEWKKCWSLKVAKNQM